MTTLTQSEAKAVNNLYYVNDQEGEIGWLAIVAPSRGRARVLYLRGVCDPDEIFTTPLTIQILAHDVELREGEDNTVEDEIKFELMDAGYWSEELGYRLTDRRYGKPASGYYGS